MNTSQTDDGKVYEQSRPRRVLTPLVEPDWNKLRRRARWRWWWSDVENREAVYGAILLLLTFAGTIWLLGCGKAYAWEDTIAGNTYALNVINPNGVGELTFGTDGTVSGWWITHFVGHQACTSTLSGTYSAESGTATGQAVALTLTNGCTKKSINETMVFVVSLGGEHLVYEAVTPALWGIQHGAGDVE